MRMDLAATVCFGQENNLVDSIVKQVRIAASGRLLPATKCSDRFKIQDAVSTATSGNTTGYVPVDNLPGVRIRSNQVFDKNWVPES